jgi:hypothetical protein
MFRKLFNKQTIIAFVLGGFLFSSAPVLAETMQYIFIESNCKLIIDGKEYSNPDIPINLYLKDQSNYAPLAVFRDICLKLNIPFEYNNTTKEINITTTRKEETVLSETLQIVPPTETQTTPATNLITSEENGLTIVEITSGEKFIELLDVAESLKSTEYQLYYYGANYYILQKLNSNNKYENVNTAFKSYNHKFDAEYNSVFNNRTLYLKYVDYINFIKNTVGE